MDKVHVEIISLRATFKASSNAKQRTAVANAARRHVPLLQDERDRLVERLTTRDAKIIEERSTTERNKLTKREDDWIGDLRAYEACEDSLRTIFDMSFPAPEQGGLL